VWMWPHTRPSAHTPPDYHLCKASLQHLLRGSDIAVRECPWTPLSILGDDTKRKVMGSIPWCLDKLWLRGLSCDLDRCPDNFVPSSPSPLPPLP
jgi:hypothetical protein